MATVVPWASTSTRRAFSWAMPARTASVGSSGVDSTLTTRPRPSTRSVKVPPVSDPIRIRAECTCRQGHGSAADRQSMPTAGKRGRLFRRDEDDLDESDADLSEDEHAWWAARESVGGVPRGNFTDADGPDESDETSHFSDYWTAESLFERQQRREQAAAQAAASAAEKDEFLEELAMDLDAAHLVLQIKVGATWEEITQAHRQLAKLYHPDRLISWSVEAREMGRGRMAEINAAHATLRALHHA